MYNVLPNEYLSGIMQKNLERIGGFKYTPEEQKFAEEIRKTLIEPPTVALGSQEAYLALAVECRLTPAAPDGRSSLDKVDTSA